MKTLSPAWLLLCLGAASWCISPANAQDPAAPAPATPAAAAPFELPNGDMTQGKELPTGWQPPGNRNIKVSRDTGVFRSSPASLCLTGTNPSPLSFGTARLPVHNGEMKSFTLSGFVGSEAGVTRSLAIEYTSEDGAGIIGDAIELPPHQDQWLPFSKKLTLPPYVTDFTLIYAITGGGSAWLDDLKVSAPEALAPTTPNT